MDFESELIKEKVAQAMEIPLSEAVDINDTLRAEGSEPLIACSARSIAVILQEFGTLTGGKEATDDEIIAPYIIADRSMSQHVVRGVALWRKARANEARQDDTIEQTT
jgi:hypothetical protein